MELHGNLNMNVLGIVWQLIHYYSYKQGLVFQSAILKCKQTINAHIEW